MFQNPTIFPNPPLFSIVAKLSFDFVHMTWAATDRAWGREEEIRNVRKAGPLCGQSPGQLVTTTTTTSALLSDSINIIVINLQLLQKYINFISLLSDIKNSDYKPGRIQQVSRDETADKKPEIHVQNTIRQESQ